jgi:hypothetical protein
MGWRPPRNVSAPTCSEQHRALTVTRGAGAPGPMPACVVDTLGDTTEALTAVGAAHDGGHRCGGGREALSAVAGGSVADGRAEP